MSMLKLGERFSRLVVVITHLSLLFAHENAHTVDLTKLIANTLTLDISQCPVFLDVIFSTSSRTNGAPRNWKSARSCSMSLM